MSKTIYVAGGCFWGVQRFYQLAFDNIKTKVGYLNSSIENPTYKKVCSNITNAVEAVKIEYNENEITLKEILDVLFLIIDPTSLNKQSNDLGTQYRTGIYSDDINDIDYAKNYIKSISSQYKKPIVVETMLLKNFFDAEEYHQDYLIKNQNGYCHIDMNLIKKIKNKN